MKFFVFEGPVACPGATAAEGGIMIGYDGDKRGSDERPIHTEKIIADRKIFFLDLKENDRGQFVKITEDVRGRRDTIMVPIEFLDDFIDALEDIREAAGD